MTIRTFTIDVRRYVTQLPDGSILILVEVERDRIGNNYMARITPYVLDMWGKVKRNDYNTIVIEEEEREILEALITQYISRQKDYWNERINKIGK